MAPDPEDLDIADLAARGGVSVRTVRYYQQQGLLNSPGVRGPGAKYGEADFNRLRLIKILQREHLPLAEIRRRLDGLDDAGVEQAVAELHRPRESAAEYARALLHPNVMAQKFSYAVQYPQRSRATWERIEIAPDIELHVRRPLSRYENKKLEQAVEHLTRFLNDEDTSWA
ncbi:MAG: MerR family transcriptional regulator [Gemmatimonadales bacterium]